jgi:hypothetical protein
LHGELPLIIGRLEDVATNLHDGVEAADWASKRDLIRALVKRVEVARDDVNIVFRIDPYPGDPDPEKKSWQLCRRSDDPALRRAGRRMQDFPIFLQHTRFQPLLHEPQTWSVVNPLLHHPPHPLMIAVVADTVEVCFYDVGILSALPSMPEGFHRLSGTLVWTIPLAVGQEVGCKDRAQNTRPRAL